MELARTIGRAIGGAVILLFAKGLIMGFAMAMPVGPVGVLCIRRTLRFGKLSGFITGSAVALADSLYGLVAGAGLTSVSNALIERQAEIRLIGGIIMLGLGLQIYFSKAIASEAEKELDAGTLAKDFFSAFAITITNPMTILSFAAVYVALGLSHEVGNDPYLIANLVIGVFLGSCAWWIFLTLLTSRFQVLLTPRGLGILNKAAGGLIVAFGAFAVITVAIHFL